MQIGSGRTKKITLGLIFLIVDFCAPRQWRVNGSRADGTHFNWDAVCGYIVTKMKTDEIVQFFLGSSSCRITSFSVFKTLFSEILIFGRTRKAISKFSSTNSIWTLSTRNNNHIKFRHCVQHRQMTADLVALRELQLNSFASFRFNK